MRGIIAKFNAFLDREIWGAWIFRAAVDFFDNVVFHAGVIFDGSTTFSANTTFNGSNNTAPSQVGVSPGSTTLMIRSQGDARYRVLPPLLAGRVWTVLPTDTGMALGTTTPAANEMEFQPFFLPYSITLTHLILNVATIGSSDSRGRVALYADNGSCAPGNLIAGTDTGELSMDTLGDREFALASPLLLNPGLYWKAARFNAPGTRPVMRTVGGPQYFRNIMGQANGGSLTHPHYYQTVPYAAFPSTYAVGSPIYVHNPFVVAMKLSAIGA